MTLWDFRTLVGRLNPSYNIESNRDELGAVYVE